MSSLNREFIRECGNGNFSQATELLRKGADPNVTSARGWNHHLTPLYCACLYGDLEFVKLLVETYNCDPKFRDEYQLTPLHYSCQHGHLNIVKYLISEQRCNPEIKGYGEQTPLHYACRSGYLSIVQYLIREQNCNPESKDIQQETSLHYACKYGNLEIVQCLIEQGSDPEIEDCFHQTPLHCACHHGHLKVVQYLISKCSCNPEVKQHCQRTPLHYACQHGHLSIVKYLISERGCSPDDKDEYQLNSLHIAFQNKQMEIVDYIVKYHHVNPDEIINSEQQTLLHCACRDGQLSLVKCLIRKHGFSPMVLDIHKQTPIDLAHQNKNMEIVQFLIIQDSNQLNTFQIVSQINQAYQNKHMGIIHCIIRHPNFSPDFIINHDQKQTLLHCACKDGHLEIVQCLINERGCSQNLRDSNQLTPLELAYQRQHMNIVHFLIRLKDFNPDSIINKDQQTLLHYACRDGHLDIIYYLISERGSNPDIYDCFQQTPLHYASKSGHLIIVENLISEQGLNPEIGDADGRTPLHYACQNGFLEVVEYLVNERRCNMEVKDRDEQTPLHFAYQNSNMDIVELLIGQQNFNPNHPINSVQETLLHCACHSGHFEIVKYLISGLKCDVEVRNKWGCTPLHYACKGSEIDIIKFLLIEGKCNPDTVDCRGESALHIACNNSAVVKVLISEGKCNVDSANINNDTALHIACRENWSISIVKYMLKVGNSNPNLKNNNGETPLELASDPEMISELIQYCANLNNVYKSQGYRHILQTKQPIQPTVKVFVVGNPSAGKSTLTAALKTEKSRLVRTFTPSRKVSGVDEMTAGVIPHDFVSKKSGHVTLYDFAGQPKFYSSHAALLQNAINTTPPIFLLVVDICESDKGMKQTILYWLSFLENQCTSVNSKPHIIVVGSHADVLRERGCDPKEKMAVVNSLAKSPKFSNFWLAGFIALDCQYSESVGMSELRRCLKRSCKSLRKQDMITFNSHCFLIYLVDSFKDTIAVTIKQVTIAIDERKNSASDQEPLYFLPSSPPLLICLCDDLNDRGHILFLKDLESIENSWIIINKAALLSQITGTIFAPEGFKQHCTLASSTGLVPLSNLAKTFPKYNLEMLVGFLSHLEFCHYISDEEILQLANEQHQRTLREETCSPINRYLLFPALISLDVPSKVWESKPEFWHYCGWVLQCCQPEEFFTSRFYQVLLLRLAFSFALEPDFPKQTVSHESTFVHFPALQRKCFIGKSGIYWGNGFGVETLVDVVEQSKVIIILMRTKHITPKYLQLRSSVLQKVIGTANEFCGKLDTIESFIDPSMIEEYPTQSITQLKLFSLKGIAMAITNEMPSAVRDTGQPQSLNNLLPFEPYAYLSKKLLCHLFCKQCQIPTHRVSDKFLQQFASCTQSSKVIVELFKPKPSLSINMHTSEDTHESETLHILKSWRDGCEGTYQCLKEKLDEFSIFAGRNILELAGDTHTVHVDHFINDESETHPDCLTLDNLRTVRKAIWDVRLKWHDLGIDLGISVTTLEVVKANNCGDVDNSFTAMLKEWLKTNPTWSCLVEALKSPPVDYPQLADQILTNYVTTIPTPDSCC